MKVSIVIPALNEARLLPGVLSVLAAERFRDFEVIVADADSKDGTADIARARGAIVTRGGRPAAGRNRGVELARGEYVFFLDADVKLPVGFVERAVREMDAQGWALATLRFDPDSESLLDQVLFGLANLYVRANLRTDPHAAGFAILVKRELFERVGGFDETLHLAEDHDFVKRATAHAPLNMLRSVRVAVDVRRLAKEGRWSYAGKCIRVEIERLLHGELQEDKIEYEFGDFELEETSESRRLLERLRARIEVLERGYAEAAERAISATKSEAKSAAAGAGQVAESLRSMTETIRALLLTHKPGGRLDDESASASSRRRCRRH